MNQRKSFGITGQTASRGAGFVQISAGPRACPNGSTKGDGYAEIRGAPIAGQRAASMARGRDLAGRIASFTDDHGMIVIYGWRATEVGAERILRAGSSHTGEGHGICFRLCGLADRAFGDEGRPFTDVCPVAPGPDHLEPPPAPAFGAGRRWSPDTAKCSLLIFTEN